MISGIPGPTGSIVQRTIFYANTAVDGVGWQTYNIPPSATMLSIFLLAGGGGGGPGRVQAASSAGGGSGGGSSGQTLVTIPAAFLPPTIFLSIGYGGVGGAGTTAGSPGILSRISVYPNTVSNHCVAIANPGLGGSRGGIGAVIPGGTGGAAAAATGVGGMPIGFSGLVQALAGQTGSSSTAAAAGTAQPFLTTGLAVMGGTAGGSLPATGSTAGGAVTTPGNSFFPPLIGGAGAVNATTLPSNGSNGINFVNDLTYFYGGTGGGSTNAAATTGGNIGSTGGAGGYGCGGGGGGGAFTGSTPSGPGGKGGDGLAIIYAW